jgi:hypothetical protein
MLKVKFISKNHWSNTSSWGMVEVMHEVLLETTKATFVFANFIIVNANKFITIDNM